MRIAELLENITPYGSLAPAEYATIAKQRDSALRQKRLSQQQARQKLQRLRHHQIWAKSRAAKPKPIKLKPVRRSKPKLRRY